MPNPPYNILQSILLVFSLILIVWTVWYTHKKQRNSLERQLLIAFISFAILSILPILTIFIWQMRNSVTDQVGESFRVMSISNSQRLGEEIAQEVDLLENLSLEEEFFARIAVTSETELTPLSAPERNTILQDRNVQWVNNSNPTFEEEIRTNVASEQINVFLKNFPEHQQLLLTDRFGGLVATGGTRPDRYYFGQADWWQNAWEEKYSDNVFIRENEDARGESTLQIAFTVEAPYTAVSRGVMQSVIQLNHLQSLREATLPEESSGEILVVDTHGEILYRSHPEKLAQESHFLDLSRINMDSDHNDWQLRQGADGESYIYSSSALISPPDYAELNDLGWTIIIQQQRKQALAIVDQLTTLAFLATLLATVMAILIGILIARWLSKPIEDLTAVTSDMARGNLGKKATPSGPIEFQTLALSFNNMTDQLHTLLNDLELEVNERKQAEKQLKSYTAELLRSNQELQDFAYAASHDLQEPLRKVRAFGSRLESRYADVLDERGLDYLSRMQDAADRMQTLIINLLDYSRVTTQAQPFAPINLNLILQNVLSDLETRIEEVNGIIFADTLPTIDADAVQIRQLLQNLISNALKFHRDGVSPIIKIKVQVQEAENQATIAISDNGIGFEDEFAERVFALFQRLHGRSQYEGTGIGLAICRKIVNRHNGTITARSVPDEGATFTINLPIHQNTN